VRNKEFEPGERLTVEKAGRKSGIGRGPVREALQRLEAEGLLRNKCAYGSRYVEYLEDSKLEDIVERYELREFIVGGAARLAAMNMNGRQIKKLRKLAGHMRAIRDTGTWADHQEATDIFYRYLFANCGNRSLLQIWNEHQLLPLTIRSSALHEKVMSLVPKNKDGEELAILSELFDAIAAHDPDRAEDCVRQRIRQITEAIRTTLEEAETSSQEILVAK